MTAVWLIAINFVRQQRILTYIFLAWVVGFGVLFGLWGGGDRSDVLALFHQQAAYGVIYTLFLAAASVHGERRSRRILLVLSKGIERHEYLAGLILGSVLMTGLYMVTLGLTNMWLAARLGLPIWPIWSTIAAATLAGVLVAAIATMFSTFAHPMVATIGTVMVAGVQAGLRAWKGEPVGMLSPVAQVLQKIFSSDFVTGWVGGWDFVPMLILQVFFFWALAGFIFQRKDVTAAIE